MRAANVVNATGVWADQLRPQELHEEAELPRIRPSRGTHITLRHEDLPLIGGAIVPAGGGRSIFALPWLGHTLIGTTDNDYEGPLEHVGPSAEDIDYLLDGGQRLLRHRPRRRADLTGAFAGVRPLISTGDPKKSVDISRKAELYETSSRDDHDHRRQAHHLAADGEDDGRPAGRARRARRTLPDAGDPARTGDRRRGAAARGGRARGLLPALAARYGYAARDVLALAAERGELAQPIVPGLPDLLAEVALAARREQARSIGDVLLRRTRLGLLAARELSAPSGSPNGGAGSGATERVGEMPRP